MKPRSSRASAVVSRDARLRREARHQAGDGAGQRTHQGPGAPAGAGAARERPALADDRENSDDPAAGGIPGSRASPPRDALRESAPLAPPPAVTAVPAPPTRTPAPPRTVGAARSAGGAAGRRRLPASPRQGGTSPGRSSRSVPRQARRRPLPVARGPACRRPGASTRPRHHRPITGPVATIPPRPGAPATGAVNLADGPAALSRRGCPKSLKREVSRRFVFLIVGGAVLLALVVVGALLQRSRAIAGKAR